MRKAIGMDETISIIVPVYNVPETYLTHCICSLIEQTYTAIEIIIVDDGSTNGAEIICDHYMEKDSRIKVIHKKNTGLSAARNTGFKASSARWIMYVDGDDWVEPNMCELMMKFAKSYNVQMVMCGMYKEYNHSIEKCSYYIEAFRKYEKKDCKWLQEQLLHFNGNIATAYCKLISKDVLTRNGILYDETLRQGAEGLEYNLRLFEHIETVMFISEYLYHYIYNENSISAKHDEENHKYVLKCFEKIKLFIDNSTNRETLMQWFNNRLLYVVITTAISGYFNPENDDSYIMKKKKYQNYLNNEIVKRALEANSIQDLSLSRRIVLICIKHQFYWLLDLLGKIRKWQKTHK